MSKEINDKENSKGEDSKRDPEQPIEVRVTHEKEKPTVDDNGLKNSGITEERERVQELKQLGREFEAPDLAEKFIDNGGNCEDLREALLERLHSRAKPVEVSEIGLTENQSKNYSLVRAIRAMAFPDNKKFRDEAAFEYDCSRMIANESGVEPTGIYMPVEVQRVLTAETATDGLELVGTDHLGSSFIDVLRNSTRVIQAGARVMTGLQGDVAIPRKTTGSSAGFVTEDADVSVSEAQFDQVTLAPKTLGAYQEYSRQLLLQSSPSIDALVRDDLAMAAALEVDRAALHGSGAAGQPEGVENVTGINTVTHAALGVPTWAETVLTETEIMTDNAPENALAYITTAAIVGSYKTTKKDAGSGIFIMENGLVNGYPVLRSNNVEANSVFFANWNELLIGMWGGLDVLIDPYTSSLKGRTRVVIHQSMDVAVRHPVSFCLGSGGV